MSRCPKLRRGDFHGNCLARSSGIPNPIFYRIFPLLLTVPLYQRTKSLLQVLPFLLFSSSSTVFSLYHSTLHNTCVLSFIAAHAFSLVRNLRFGTREMTFYHVNNYATCAECTMRRE